VSWQADLTRGAGCGDFRSLPATPEQMIGDSEQVARRAICPRNVAGFVLAFHSFTSRSADCES